jgi:hypothetical protein
METRKEAQIIGLGGKITHDDEFLTGCKLPTIRQIIRCYKFHKDIIGLDNDESMKEVISQIELYYKKANIPLLSYPSLKKNIKDELKHNNNCRKMNLQYRESKAGKTSLEKENLRLNSTFKGYPNNAINKIKIEEDKLFLKSMMTDRVATMAGLDTVLANKVKKRRDREEAEENRRTKMLQELNDSKVIHEDKETGYLLLNIKKYIVS